MGNTKDPNRRKLTLLILILSFSFIFTAFLLEEPQELFLGAWKIITSPGILITDFIALSSLGSAFFNSGLTTLICLGLAWIIDARFNGYLISAFLTVMGFAFFGKTPFNVLPIFLGVYLFNRFLAKKPAKDLIAPLLFGTTLGPVVSQVAFGFGLGPWGLIIGISLGIICGILLAAIMDHVYSLHQGYNLYNTGTSAGFVATVIYIMMRGLGLTITPEFYWSTNHTDFLSIYFLIMLAVIVLFGILWGGTLNSYKRILRFDGLLATDYVELTDLGSTLINVGVLGLIGLGYVRFVGGDVNGPIIAGIFTLAGFGALGKHPRNSIPVMLGVYLMCIPNIWQHTEPGPMLAALFCTTLAPFSGKFGFFAGILAGAIHLPMVMHVGSIHGFMNLYNNGFAGGLAMLLVIGFIKGLWPEILEDDWKRIPWRFNRENGEGN